MNKSSKTPYILLLSILLSTLLFSLLGFYWNISYYHNKPAFSATSLPFATAMQGFHDGLYTRGFDFKTTFNISQKLFSSSPFTARNKDIAAVMVQIPGKEDAQNLLGNNKTTKSNPGESPNEANAVPMSDSSTTEDGTIAFTTATDEYFEDACFIGDSRTVGLSEFSGIENATFLCKSSLSIYDYDKPKITYEDKKTSVHDVLMEKQFGKIYLMVGINECGTGTPESFFERYRQVLENIRELQPNAIIFIQANLTVTEEKSAEEEVVTNENISARNEIISQLANQRDIFYIDVNESSLCEDGILIPDYTWDQVHIKAQYYTVWKDFLLQHAIIVERPSIGESEPSSDENTPIDNNTPEENSTPENDTSTETDTSQDSTENIPETDNAQENTDTSENNTQEPDTAQGNNTPDSDIPPENKDQSTDIPPDNNAQGADNAQDGTVPDSDIPQDSNITPDSNTVPETAPPQDNNIEQGMENP